MERKPNLLEVFLHFGDVRSLDKRTQAALRLCNHQIKKVIDAAVISCRIKPADVVLICACDWKLKELNIEGNWDQESLRVLPNALFKNFPLLETLKIHGCTELEALPENIEELIYLTDITIYGNTLATVPPSLGSSQLTALVLYGCRALTLQGLAPLKQLQQLKILEVGGQLLREDAMFPDWICDNITTGLLDLSLGDARSLPSTISNFKQLTSLCLEDTFVDALPESIGLLSSLAVLNCPLFEPIELPQSFSQLEALEELDLAVTLDLTAPLQYFTGLTHLGLHVEADSKYPDVIWNLTSLKSLRLSGNAEEEDDADAIHIFEEVKLPEDIENLKNLESLCLSNVKNMFELPQSIGTLSCLTKLDFWDVGVESLPDSIEKLKGLKIMDLSNCGNLCGLPSSIEGLDSLEELQLRHNPELRKLPDAIGELNALKVFILTDCRELTAIPESFADLAMRNGDKNWSLEKVVISYCPNLVLSPKMKQAIKVLRSRGVLVKK
jgi:Leucine-rich repeat (LRR) protein